MTFPFLSLQPVLLAIPQTVAGGTPQQSTEELRRLADLNFSRLEQWVRDELRPYLDEIDGGGP